MESHFPHAPPLLNLLAFLSSVMHACFWLVVAFEISVSSHLRPRRFYIVTFLLLSFLPQTMVWHPPHTFRPDCAPSPISLLPQMLTFGWLLCCPTKRWPPKAEVASLSVIFDVLRSGAWNEGTNSNESTSNAARLVWDHRDQRRQDLGPWRMLPWQKLAKPLGGRAAVSHVGCCVFCVVVFCAGPYFWQLLANRHVEIWSETSLNGQLCCIHNIKSTTKPPKCYDM